MSASADRLASLQDDLNSILEERITDLMAHIKAVQKVTGQISAIEADIALQTTLASELEEEAASLKSDNGKLKRRVAKLEDSVEKMRTLREQLMSTMSGLTNELKTHSSE